VLFIIKSDKQQFKMGYLFEKTEVKSTSIIK